MNFGGTVRLNKYGIFVILCIFIVYSLHLLSKKASDDRSEANKFNLRTLLSVAIKAAENGGKRVVENKDHMNVKSKGKTKEGLQDSVTNADVLSHCSMTSTIKHFFPSIKLISEEAVKHCEEETPEYDTVDFVSDDNEQFVNKDDVTVWIDPLDATHEYTEKLYQYVTTMVCVAVKGKPIIGVIHKPFEKITSWAWVGVSKSEDLDKFEEKASNDNLKVIVSRSHKGDIEKILQKKFDKKVAIISAAGAGYKALEVAKHQVDAYLHITAIKKWDVCAGNAVLNALGGKMLNKYGNELDYSNDVDVVNENGLIASLTKYKDFVGNLDL